MSLAEPLIVGGGPAGAAAAIHLSRAGAQPTIVERRAADADPLCGGFLSWRTLVRLAQLGLPAEALGGPPITALRAFHDARSHAFALPAPAMALSRRRLDALLIARAEAMGARVLADTASWRDGRLRLASGEAVESESLFLATGKQDLPGLSRPRGAAGNDPLLGLRLRLPVDEALRGEMAGRIELHLFAGGYLGAVLQEDGTANLCLAVRKSRLASAGGQPATLLARLAQASPALAARLAAMPPAPHIDAVGHVPYGWRATGGEPGLFRLGDQAAVIPSLAGEGIGVALASAECAVQFWREGGAGAAPAYQRAFAARLRRPFAAAGAIAMAAMHPMAGLPLGLLATLPGSAWLIARLTRV